MTMKLFLERYQQIPANLLFLNLTAIILKIILMPCLGIDEQHPLVRINNFNEEYGINNIFLIDDFVKLSKFSDDQDIRFLMNLANQGFVIYNSSLGTVVVKDNVKRYLMAKSEKEDYDVIRFKSDAPLDNVNAILDLNTMDLRF